MIVRDILSTAETVFGKCDSTKLYRYITDAVELLANESNWDAMTGYITLSVDETTGCIALPHDVETPLGVQIDGYPAFNRDKWYQYHINGAGNFTRIDAFRDFWDDLGEFPTIRELSGDVTITATNDDALDNAVTIRVFGYDENNEEVYTGGVRGVDLSMGVSSTVKFARITDIEKPQTTGVIRLNETVTGDLLGIYYPFETKASFRRMRVPKSTTITMRYRKRTREVKSDLDYIPLDSRLALQSAMESIKAMNVKNLEEAAQWRQYAVSLANAEQKSRNAQSGIGPQVQNFSQDINRSLRGGRYRGSRCCTRGYS